MRTLVAKTDTFDQANTFRAVLPRRGYAITCYVWDGRKHGEGVLIMQRGVCIKNSYTEADYAEERRLTREQAVENGDVVLFEGKPHRVEIKGDYSDAGRLVLIEGEDAR